MFCECVKVSVCRSRQHINGTYLAGLVYHTTLHHPISLLVVVCPPAPRLLTLATKAAQRLFFCSALYLSILDICQPNARPYAVYCCKVTAYVIVQALDIDWLALIKILIIIQGKRCIHFKKELAWLPKNSFKK